MGAIMSYKLKGMVLNMYLSMVLYENGYIRIDTQQISTIPTLWRAIVILILQLHEHP